jgi:choline kinase
VKGVIVAAGLGQRLSLFTSYRPKPLLSVLERPLIDYTIEAFARTGFEEVGVVLGYNGDIVRRYLEDSSRYGIAVYCLHNAQYRRGNATSVYAARTFTGGEPFILAMADHLVSPRILHRLLTCSWTTHVLGVDRRTRAGPTLRDAARVWLDKDGRVQRIGKGLKRWHAVDVGVFLFWPRVFDHLSDLLQHSGKKCSITHLVRRMIARGDDLCACDVSGAFWLDVDTPDHLIYTRRVLSVELASTGLPQQELVA